MKSGILSNWNLMRFVRLALGVAIIIQSVMAKDWVLGIIGVLFTSMPVFNIGCCSTQGCSTPSNNGNKENTKDISYEEVV